MAKSPTPSGKPEPSVRTSPSGVEGDEPAVGGPGQSEVVAHMAEFAELTPPATGSGTTSFDHLTNVPVRVTAELGRVTMPISDILKLGIGSVVELDRAVSEPVDLMIQGVPVARGEVVVVDDRFAIRIKEIPDPKKRPTST